MPRPHVARDLRITPIDPPESRVSAARYKVGDAVVSLIALASHAISIDCTACESAECEHANALRRAVLVGTARVTVGT